MGTNKRKGIREVEKISRKREGEVRRTNWPLSKECGWCGVHRMNRRIRRRRNQNKFFNWINELGESSRSPPY